MSKRIFPGKQSGEEIDAGFGDMQLGLVKFTGVGKWVSDKLAARLEMLNIAQQFVFN